jgi:transposase InsO family protein
VQPLTFRTLHVLVFIGHARREPVHLNGTASPTAAWVGRQLLQATPGGRVPRSLVRDRDAVDGGGCAGRARRRGVQALLTPVRAPRADAVVERLVGTLRRGCLDQPVIANAAHLRSVLAEFVRYHDHERPHRSPALQTPLPAIRVPAGPVRASPILGGLHHVYKRVA